MKNEIPFIVFKYLFSKCLGNAGEHGPGSVGLRVYLTRDARRVSLFVAKVAAAIAIVALLYAMFGRFGYDCELEWMTGSIHDSVDRMRAGQSLYTEPSVDWTPFMYPPLYFGLVARLMDVVSFHSAARGLSIFATFLQAACVWRLAASHGASRGWCFVAVGIFAALFGFTSYWYDLERVDTLFVGMMALGILILVERDGYLFTAIAGVIVGLGFFAKQPGIVFVVSALAGLVFERRFVRAAIFGVTAGSVVLAGVAWLQWRSGGWFGYYVLVMPGAHGVVGGLFKVLFFEDVPKAFALVGAAAAFVVGWVRRRLRGERSNDGVLACTLVGAAFASGSSRVHLGGWDNVLMFFTTFGSVAIAIVGSRIDRRARTEEMRDGRGEVTGHGGTSPRGTSWVRASIAAPAVVVFQMILWAFDPSAAVPPRAAVRDARAFEAKVKELEVEGEVLVFGVGHVTTPPHAHHAAIVDVFRTEKRVPETLLAPFRERRFAAIVLNTFDDLQLMFLPEGMRGRFYDVVMANYFVSERLPYDMPDAHVGFHTHPRYVLRRRTELIDEYAPELVRCRAKTERAIVEARERITRGGGTSGATPDIEGASRAACERALAETKPFGWVPDDALIP